MSLTGTVGRSTPMTICFLPMKFTEEDAIIMNQRAADFGALMGQTTRIYTMEAASSNSTSSSEFTKPELAMSKRCSSYDAIDNKGQGIIGKKVKGNDVVIGCVKTNKRNISGNIKQRRSMLKQRDVSVVSRKDEGGEIIKSEIVHLPSGSKSVTHVSTSRFIQRGDKLTSFASQKVNKHCFT